MITILRMSNRSSKPSKAVAPKPSKGVAMQTLVIDIDDSQKKSAHEKVIAFCNVCENLATHHCKTCDRNLCKFCIIDHYKNTAFTKDHDMEPI